MKTNTPSYLTIWPVKKYRKHMINKIISKLIRGVLLLEIHLRGPRIKHSAWRAKIIKSQYIQSHCVYPIHEAPPKARMLADTHRKVAYLPMLKVAYTSIGRTFFENESHRRGYNQWVEEKHVPNPDLRPRGLVSGIYNNEEIKHLFPLNNMINIENRDHWRITGRNTEENFRQKKITLDEVNSYFVFTFVRNPFSRFVSFFNNVYYYQNGKYHIASNANKGRYNFWVQEVSSFSELVYKTSKFSDCHLNPHAFPQHLYTDNLQAGGGKIDFIGKFETLEQDFEPIRQKFNLLYLEHQNKSKGEHKDWRDYYTPKTAKMIYQRYRKDFEMFGYEDEYPKLLDYLATKQKKA